MYERLYEIHFTKSSKFCIARKTTALSANVETVLNFGRVLTSETQKLSAELDVFIKNTTQGLAKLRSDEDQYQAKELENLAGLSGRVNDQIQRVQDVMSLIHAKDELSAEALTTAQTAVKEAHDSIRAVFSSWSDKLEKSGLSLRADFEKSSTDGFRAVRTVSSFSVIHIMTWTQVEKALNSIAVLIQSVIHDSQEYISAERKHSIEVRSLAESQAEEQIRYLKEQNAQLTRMLQYEKSKSERMKKDLVERVSGLFNDFVTERDRSLEEAFTKIKQENGQVESTLNGFTEEYSRKADEVMTRNQELSTFLEKKGEQCKRLRDGAIKVILIFVIAPLCPVIDKATQSLGGVSDTVLEGLSNMQGLVTTSLSTYSAEITRQTHVLSSTAADGKYHS
jgi:kinesin family protein 11